MLVKGDVLIGISNSGESDEIRTLLPVVKTGHPLISISRDKRGILPRSADVALTLGRLDRKLGPLGLAPTSSTTATLALGDALAVALVHKHFTSEDFALSHLGHWVANY